MMRVRYFPSPQKPISKPRNSGNHKNSNHNKTKKILNSERKNEFQQDCLFFTDPLSYFINLLTYSKGKYKGKMVVVVRIIILQ